MGMSFRAFSTHFPIVNGVRTIQPTPLTPPGGIRGRFYSWKVERMENRINHNLANIATKEQKFITACFNNNIKKASKLEENIYILENKTLQKYNILMKYREKISGIPQTNADTDVNPSVEQSGQSTNL